MLFKRKNTKRHDDRIWTTEKYKFEGICTEISEELTRLHSVLVTAHFEKTMGALRETMSAKGIEYDELSDSWEFAEMDLGAAGEPRLFSFLSELLPAPRQADQVPAPNHSSEARIHLVVAEHYPLPERDARILSFAEAMPFQTTVRFHASLDEPLLGAFGADRTFGLLSSLGWKKTECISSPTTTRAIASGQAKIKRIAVSDEKVNSQKEWFYYNCPALRDRMK